MEFRGSRVPKVKSAVSEAIRDLHKACVDEGATDLELPTGPLTYSALVTKLRELGLIPPSPPKVAPGVAASRAEQVEQHQQMLLLGTHRNEAANYLDGADSVEHAEHVDNLDGQETEVLQTFDISAAAASGSNLILMDENVVHTPNISLATGLHEDDATELNKTIETLKKENIDANNYITEMQGQMNTLNHQVLVLENKNSTDNSAFLDDLKGQIKTMISDCFQTLEFSLLSKLRQEIRSELVGHSEHILKGIGSTDSVRDLCEGIHNNVLILKDWNSDLSDSVANSLVDIKEKIDSPYPANDGVDKVGKSVDKMSSQLTAMKTLLVDTLTKNSPDVVQLPTPPKTPGSNPTFSGPSRKRSPINHFNRRFTDSQSQYQKDRQATSPKRSRSRSPRSRRYRPSSPGRSSQCNLCNGRDHLSHACPNKQPVYSFCPRCLDTRHKSFKCPFLTHRCHVCHNSGVSEELSHGHCSAVHGETDPKRRDYILKHLPTVCFKNWSTK